jgi:hypothetical protein
MAKSFSWSYSKLKNYDTCPKRHEQVDILKNYTDEGGEALVWGNQVHDAFKVALKTHPHKLPAEMADYQHWVDSTLQGPGQLLVEQKYAITRDFQACAYFAPNAWFRCIGDAVRIDGPVGVIRDWKTGKLLVDSAQLFLTAQCLFSHFPALRRVKTEFVWLKDDAATPEFFNRSDMAGGWVGLLPRVQELENAAITMTYPPKPGKLCYRWCPVSSCPFHGKSNR